MEYPPGAVLSCETGGVAGCDARTTEFKKLDCPIHDLEGPLIRRLPRFAIACLNARINGTMYLGVEDSGEVVGMPIPITERRKVQDIFDANFCGENPKLFVKAQDIASVVRQCIIGPIFIPIKGDPTRNVIEFDIKPRGFLCEKTIFFLKTKEPLEDEDSPPRLTEGKKKKKNRPERYIYFRQGTKSQSIKEDKADWLRKEVDRCARELDVREYEEDVRRSENPLPLFESQLRKLILRARPWIDDDELTYCLLLDNVPQESFSWIGSVRWSFVLDLHDDFNFIQKLPKENMVPKQLTYENLKKFQAEYQSRDELREAVEFSDKTTWVLTTKEGLSSIEWQNEAKNAIYDAVSTFLDEAAVRMRQNVVFILLINSNQHLDVLSTMLHDIKAIINNDEQFVLLFGSDELRQGFRDNVSKFFARDRYMEQSLVLRSWKVLNTFVMGRVNKRYSTSGIVIPHSSNIGAIVPGEFVKRLRNEKIELLALNQCQELPTALDANAYVSKGTKTIREFFKGGSATWELFHFSLTPGCVNKGIPPGVVVRPYVQDIINEIRLSFCRTNRGMVQLCRLVHVRGSGGTTVAMNVLWELKEDARLVNIANTKL